MDTSSEIAGKAIIPVLACVLNQLCIRNDNIPVNSSAISKFHALKPPAIVIKDYLDRICKYAACSNECFVLALVYIDRIIQNNTNFVVNSLNIHRLLITSIMLAAKFFDDQYFNNAYYAKVGGVPCVEINALEIEFLFMINFNLFGTTETFRQYYTELCNHVINSPCNSGIYLYPLRWLGLSLEYVNDQNIGNISNSIHDNQHRIQQLQNEQTQSYSRQYIQNNDDKMDDEG